MSAPATTPEPREATGDAVMKGIFLMVLAMLAVPAVDAAAKQLSLVYSPLFIAWARYAASSAVVAPLAIGRFGRNFLPRERRLAHVLRTFFMVAAMVCYFSAIATIPLADAISAYFVGPIIASLVAVPLLGERLTPRKLAALGLGFAGALIIVQPGGAIQPGILLALASGLLFAGYMITSRQAALSSDPVKTLALQNLLGVAMLTPLAIWVWPESFAGGFWLIVAMGVFSAASHFLSINAFRFADASTLAPYVYVELLGSVAYGFLVFGDWPGAAVWIGAALIVAGGTLLLKRRATT